MSKYNPQEIEKKWQKYWLENKIFKAEIDPQKPKYYVLDMFPYPSGTGLHVGHVIGYTATDIIARYKRQCGYNVMHPMGWDSFGLPAEQYAVRTGTHPAITTQKNTQVYRRQLQELGFSYDWDREIATSDSTYYKWTQWIFTKLYERGLAYQADVMVNYCPYLGTVLANEEVENGYSKEGGHPVIRKPLRQWMLKITAYADRLIQDLELVDWPESLKKLQIHWIGRSEGTQIDFLVKDTEHTLSVFTTRPDTLFGVTYIVLAPEHPLVNQVTHVEWQKGVVDYQEKAAAKSDLDRTELNKEKNGVFTGAYATHPVTGVDIPIWIADYVLINYGFGAVMAVPAHDERDFTFAKKYHLPIRPVIEPDSLSVATDSIPTASSLEDLLQRVRMGKTCWSGNGRCIHSHHADISLDGLESEEAKRTMTEWLTRKGRGKKRISYKLRDWLFSRQRYWGEPFPILHFSDGTQRPLDLDELPLCLPDITDYKPSGDGLSPLVKARDWVEIVDKKTGKPAQRETNTMPNWAGSCWYYLRFEDPHNTEEAWSREAEKYWGAVDLYVGGVEHAVLHLLYARFWHKVLYDCGYVSTLEPFKSLRNQGLMTSRSYRTAGNVYIPPHDVVEKEGVYFHKTTQEMLFSQVEKMSKSKLNGVTPDEVIQEHGTDALRVYEMFMGPFEKEKVWSTEAVSGSSRFLTRFYDMATSEKVSEEESSEALKLGYRLVDGVIRDIEAMLFNTAIAKMMEFLNEFTKLPKYPVRVVKMAVQALMPFAPHLAEELWEKLGCTERLSTHPYPAIEAHYLEDAFITYIVQINGKLRGRFEFPKDQSEEVVLNAAKNHPGIMRFLEGKTVVKAIFVPNKLLNLVTD
jgi:leucyl-tRNA synthetase